MVMYVKTIDGVRLVTLSFIIVYQAAFTIPSQTNWFVCLVSVIVSAIVIQYYLWVVIPQPNPTLLSIVMAVRDLLKIFGGFFYESFINNRVMRDI